MRRMTLETGTASPVFPAWAGWAALALAAAVQAVDVAGIADWLGVAVLVLGGAATVVIVPRPRTGMAMMITAMSLNAVAYENSLLSMLVMTLWASAVVGAHLPLRHALGLLVGLAAAAVALDLRALDLSAIQLLVRAIGVTGLYGLPCVAGVAVRHHWGVARDVQARNELFRRALSRDLHDTAVHATTSMVMRANEALLRTDLDDRSRRDFQFIADTGREATRTLRQTLTSLRHTDVTQAPPSADASWFRARLRGEQARLEQAGFTVRSTVEGPLTNVPPQVLASLGRICTEMTNNVLRHAAPDSEVTVMVENTGTALTLMGSNAIGGAEPDPGRTRLGIIGISELAEALGGTVTASAMGPHWVTHVSIPISSPTSTDEH